MRDNHEIYEYSRQIGHETADASVYRDAKANVSRRERAALKEFRQAIQKRLKNGNAEEALGSSPDENVEEALESNLAENNGTGRKNRRPVVIGLVLASLAAVILVVAFAVMPYSPTPSAAPDSTSPQNAPQVSASSDVSSTSALGTEAESEATVEHEEAQDSSNEILDDVETVVDSYHGYSVGDVVYYTGTVHYASSKNDELRGAVKGGKAMITAINPEGRHAFHVVHMDDDSALYGWVDESFLSKV